MYQSAAFLFSAKLAAADSACSCGCGDTVKTCKCGPDCKCRKPGGSCYKSEKQANELLEKLLSNNLLMGSLKGGLMGGAAGAISAEKGKILRGALRGATFGVPVGLLSAAGGKAFKGFSDTELAYGGKPVNALPGYQQVLHRGAEPAGVVLGAIAGVPLGARLLSKVDSEIEKSEQKKKTEKSAATPAWQRSAGKNEEGGLNAKGRASYNKATGGHLKAPVTESNPKGDRAKRQNSFCSRMCGMKKHETGSDTKKDPDSRINKSLRKWNCKCGNAQTQEQTEWQMEITRINLQQLGAKIAASSCSYHDMPNSPTNKKHMTGASPAVLEADEQSEEIGKPESDKTEHSESVISGKLAAFGVKVARGLFGSGPELSDPRSGLTSTNGDIDIERAMRLPSTTTKQDRWPDANPVLEAAPDVMKYLDYPAWLKYIGSGLGNAAGGAFGGMEGRKATNSQAARDAVANLGTPDPAAAVNATFDPPSAGGSAPAGSGAAAPAAAGAKADGGKGGINPYLLAGGIGLGGAGLYGLYHYLNSKPKKKREEEDKATA